MYLLLFFLIRKPGVECTKAYEPDIRVLLATDAHFCEVVGRHVCTPIEWQQIREWHSGNFDFPAKIIDFSKTGVHSAIADGFSDWPKVDFHPGSTPKVWHHSRKSGREGRQWLLSGLLTSVVTVKFGDDCQVW